MATEYVNQAFPDRYWSAQWVYRAISHFFSVRRSSTVGRLIPRASLVLRDLQHNPAHIRIKLDVLSSLVFGVLIVLVVD